MAEKNYPYAVGRIRAIEKNLLTPAKFELLIGAASLDEAFKVLTDSGYKSSGEKSGDYETLLKEELSNTYALLKSLVPDSELFNVFLYKNDYHNLKVLLKEELLGVDGEDALYKMGSVSLKELKVYFADRQLDKISPIMSEVVQKASEVYAKTGDFQLADIEIDKGAFLEMDKTAKKSDNAFVIDVIKAMIDFTNIKTRIRVEKMGKGAQFLETALLSGGTIGEKALLDLSSSNAFSYFGECYDLGKKEGITLFEKYVDDYIIEFAKKAKYMPLTIEPLIAYLLAKENEIKTVRIIMVGKENNIEAETLRERLRKTYV